MFLVEYSQIKGKHIFNYCSGFYSSLEAFNFALQLNMCSNIESILISEIETKDSKVLYRNDFVQRCPDNRDSFNEIIKEHFNVEQK